MVEELPTRKQLDHRGPISLDITGAWYFITICATERVDYGRDGVPPPSASNGPFMAVANDILECARQYHIRGKWKLALFLVMPDHIHFIVHVPTIAETAEPIGETAEGRGGTPSLPHVMQHWKHYVSEHFGVSFQKDFFDTRLRDDAHYAEKFRYICNNPVRKQCLIPDGRAVCPKPPRICTRAVDWPYVIAFDRETGLERPHR